MPYISDAKRFRTHINRGPSLKMRHPVYLKIIFFTLKLERIYYGIAVLYVNYKIEQITSHK